MKDKSKNRFHRSDLAVFFSFFRPHLGLFALDMSCAVAVAVIDLAFPYITRVSMQTLLPEKLYTTFFVIMAAMFAAYILKGLMYYLITVLGHRMGVYIEADMRHAVFNHMQRLSFSFFDRNRTGALMSRITSDLFEITELAHHGPEDILISVLTIIGSLIVLAGIEWRLALVLAVCLPLLILFTLSRRVSMKRANIEVKRQTAEINAAIESGISGIRTAKAFANEQAEDEKFVAANERYKAARSRYFKAMGGFMSGMEFTTSVMQVLVVAAGGALIMGGRMDYVDLVTFSLYVSTFVTPVRKLASFSEVYMQGTAGFSRFLELMRTEPDVQDAPDAAELRDVKGEVEYRDVSFSYNDEAGPVLEHVSLKIAPGEKLAVVGPSGGGKTTLCQLLPRFYDVTGGAVLVDGVDVRQYRQKALREKVASVLQKSELFSATIAENIAWGAPDASAEQIRSAAVTAQADGFISSTALGYDTPVAERGMSLSGGQKQRISISRAVLKNAEILIFDDSTSALDLKTEANLHEALRRSNPASTKLIVAQRIASVRRADRIVVLEGGRIAACGTHSELLSTCAVYQDIYRSQIGEEESA